MSDLRLRDVVVEDSRDLWEWRNDLLTRQNSIETEPVPLAAHEKWLAASLANPMRVMRIIESDGIKCGTVRCDRLAPDRNTWRVSIVINPLLRGRGFGRTALALSCVEMEERYGARDFVADVRTRNTASLLIFRRCGFDIVSESQDFFSLRRSPMAWAAYREKGSE